MKNALIYTLRVISYVLLPIGSYHTFPLTDLISEVAVVGGLIVLPMLVILFVRPQTEAQKNGSTATTPTTFFGIFHKPTLKQFGLDLIAIIVLLVLGLLEVILGLIIILIMSSPNCGQYHILDIFQILYYCLISR